MQKLGTGQRRYLMRGGVVAALLTLALVATACGSSSPSSSGSSGNGTTATYAEAAQTPPNYIFPFMSLAFFTVNNINQFQQLMYRPLYWFGNGNTPNLLPSLSLAQNPVYSNGGSTVVVNLKPYKWSNGETVTAQDVMFWMNMLHAQKANWAAYSAGAMPDDLSSVVANSPTQLTFTVTGKVNSYWFTYNELSQITPMPVAWDITAPGAKAGSGGCSAAPYGTADAACTAVYTFLSKQAGYNPANPNATNNSFSTYATNPIWQVVDGPFRLTHFDATGNVTMVPNPTYSGPIKPTIKKFIELPYTSDSAEYNALVGGQVNVGYLPSQDITATTSNPLEAGPNNPRLSNFNLDPLYTWSINYFPYNFDSTGDNGNAGKIFQQLYFRQAFQDLVDQPLYIKKLYHNYGINTYGPVPVYPANNFASSFEKSNPYPYDPTKAKSLLESHGWKVVPGGTSTCSKPGTAADECGAGIPAGAQLAFVLQYASGTTITANTMNAEKSSWSQAGINITLTSASFNSVVGTAVPCPTGCAWQLQNWGAGWVFAPDYYPTGESIFQSGAGSNSGNYSDATNDANIIATNTTDVNLVKYENYLATNLPVVYQPNYVTAMTEIQKGLSGVTPQSPLWAINPENWRWNS
jgi:peptide/nickel transport system substrate-binding protein